jgi:hypothetical protein
MAFSVQTEFQPGSKDGNVAESFARPNQTPPPMQELRTCLLISDDPDDHFEFAEALHDALPGSVLISILESNKIADLLRKGKVTPDFVIVDISTSEAQLENITMLMKTQGNLGNMKVITYGEEERSVGIAAPHLSKDYTYTELKEFLRRELTER